MSETLSDRRRAKRQLSILTVRCKVGRRVLPAAWLTELSTLGCRLVTRAGLLTPGQRVTIEPKDLASITGLVKWTADIQAGIEFVDPLEEEVVQRLLSDAVPCADEKSLVDRFGRPMPELPRSSRLTRTSL